MTEPGGAPPGASIRARRTGRRLALDVLYEAEIRDSLPADAFEARLEGGWVIASGPEDDPPEVAHVEPAAVAYARFLVSGVQEHQASFDQLIAAYADRWAVERMPIVDRNLLRIALFELSADSDVPVAVAINEAVELAKALSTDDSGRFVNGLLGRIVEEERRAGPA